MIKDETIALLNARIATAYERFGPFASTHEAIGVALEEWHEILDELRANRTWQLRRECLDMAAVLIRLYEQIGDSEPLRKRSVK